MAVRMTLRSRGFALLLLLSAALPAPGVLGDEAAIAEIRVRVDGNLARVDLHLEDAFSDEFVEQLESGLPTGFIYHLELLKDRKRWFDHTLATSKLQVAAMYDAATRGYLINYKLDGKLVESRMVRDLDEVRRAMTVIEDVPAFQLDPYPRSWRLMVRARAAVGSRTVLFFVPARAITDWRESRKFRTLNERPEAG